MGSVVAPSVVLGEKDNNDLEKGCDLALNLSSVDYERLHSRSSNGPTGNPRGDRSLRA